MIDIVKAENDKVSKEKAFGKNTIKLRSNSLITEVIKLFHFHSTQPLKKKLKFVL